MMNLQAMATQVIAQEITAQVVVKLDREQIPMEEPRAMDHRVEIVIPQDLVQVEGMVILQVQMEMVQMVTKQETTVAVPTAAEVIPQMGV